MGVGYKWLMTIAMLIGRVEILSVFAAIAGLPIWAVVKRIFGVFRGKPRRKSLFK